MLIHKYTEGHVTQIFDTETEKWVSQEFIADGGDCNFVVKDGEIVCPEDVMPNPEPYLPYDMVQPQ